MESEFTSLPEELKARHDALMAKLNSQNSRNIDYYKKKFEKNLRKYTGDGHWLLENTPHRKDGYAMFSINGKQYTAARAAMMLYEPDYYNPKRKLYHTCILKSCVSPYHMSQEVQDDLSSDDYDAGIIVKSYKLGLGKRNKINELHRIFKTKEFMIEVVHKMHDMRDFTKYMNPQMVAEDYDMTPSSVELLMEFRAQLSIPRPDEKDYEDVL